MAAFSGGLSFAHLVDTVSEMCPSRTSTLPPRSRVASIKRHLNRELLSVLSVSTACLASPLTSNCSSFGIGSQTLRTVNSLQIAVAVLSLAISVTTCLAFHSSMTAQ